MDEWEVPAYPSQAELEADKGYNGIDWEALGEVEDGNYGWRAALVPPFELSNRYVPGEGEDPIAMVIGEAPGAQEDAQLRPFVGPSGVVLRQLMSTAGLYAEDAYEDGRDSPPTAGSNCWLTNVVHFRPLPNNRTPSDTEIKVARMWLRQEWIAIGKPRIIIPVGGIATLAVLGYKMSILRISGQHLLRTSNVDRQLMHVWPMVHPSFGLRSQGIQPLIEQDWEKLGEWLRNDMGSGG